MPISHGFILTVLRAEVVHREIRLKTACMYSIYLIMSDYDKAELALLGHVSWTDASTGHGLWVFLCIWNQRLYTESVLTEKVLFSSIYLVCKVPASMDAKLCQSVVYIFHQNIHHQDEIALIHDYKCITCICLTLSEDHILTIKSKDARPVLWVNLISPPFHPIFPLVTNEVIGICLPQWWQISIRI